MYAFLAQEYNEVKAMLRKQNTIPNIETAFV
jgi:hypothetical protein